jgi:hypothetical protein
MCAQIFFVTSLRGSGCAPTILARCSEGCMGFMKALFAFALPAAFAIGFLHPETSAEAAELYRNSRVRDLVKPSERGWFIILGHVPNRPCHRSRAHPRQKRRHLRPRIRCPLCGWSPGKDDHWSCTCGNSWNTFDTGGVCPNCLHQSTSPVPVWLSAQ